MVALTRKCSCPLDFLEVDKSRNEGDVYSSSESSWVPSSLNRKLYIHVLTRAIAMNANMLQAQVLLIPAKLLQHCCSTVVWNNTSDSAKQCSMDLHSALTCKLSTPIQTNTAYQWLVHHLDKGPLVGFFLAPQGCFVYHGTPSKLDLKEGILISNHTTSEEPHRELSAFQRKVILL